MSYAVADGYNNAAGLTTLTPQPASDGILYARIVGALSHAVYRDGPHTIWRYQPELDETSLASVLTQLGLSSAAYNEVTVTTNAGGNRATWVNYNAVVQWLVNPRYRRGLYRSTEFMVVLVEAL